MDAADRYAEEICKNHPVEEWIATINDFCAGWRAADSHPNWIPVEMELPKRTNKGSRFSETVLVYNKAGFIDITYYDYKEKEWKWAPAVTHWMPIPQPPQIKEE